MDTLTMNSNMNKGIYNYRLQTHKIILEILFMTRDLDMTIVCESTGFLEW